MQALLGVTLITTEVTDLSTQKYVPVLHTSAATAVVGCHSSNERVSSWVVYRLAYCSENFLIPSSDLESTFAAARHHGLLLQSVR